MERVIATLREWGSFAATQLEYRLSGKDPLAGLKRDYYKEVLEEIEKEPFDHNPCWTIKVVKPVLEKQTGKIYRFDNTEFRDDWRQAIGRLKAAETFGFSVKDKPETELAIKFLVDLVKEALCQEFSYRRYAA
jgi:hypothetical protein